MLFTFLSIFFLLSTHEHLSLLGPIRIGTDNCDVIFRKLGTNIFSLLNFDRRFRSQPEGRLLLIDIENVAVRVPFAQFGPNGTKSLNSLASSSAVTMRRGPLTGSFSRLCCLNNCSSASSTSLRSGFHKYLTRNPFCSEALTDLFFQIVWTVELTRPNSRHTSTFLFPLSVSFIHLHIKPFVGDCSYIVSLLLADAVYDIFPIVSSKGRKRGGQGIAPQRKSAVKIVSVLERERGGYLCIPERA
jgi:hypothetical protein